MKYVNNMSYKIVIIFSAMSLITFLYNYNINNTRINTYFNIKNYV